MVADPITLRQLQIDSELDINIIDGDTVSIRDIFGRDYITLRIPDLYGNRQLSSPQTINLVGGLPNTTYYLYATEPVPPWGAESDIASSFRLIISTDGNLTYKHRLLFKLFTDGAGNIISTSEEFPHFTEDEMHVYANSVTGDDANDGLTPATAKKTLQAVFDIVPFHVIHNVSVHIEGSFAPGNLERSVAPGKMLIIDGGSGVTVIADDGGNPWAADISSSSSIGLSTLAWTPDEYEGFFVEILSGPCVGQTRLIQKHDATTITPVRNFSTDPGAGAQFRIVRPSTMISGGYSYIAQTSGYPVKGGEIKLQRVYFDYTGVLLVNSNDGEIILSHVILDKPPPGVGFNITFRASGYVIFSGNYTDPNTFLVIGGTTVSYAGVKAGNVEFEMEGSITIAGSVIRLAVCLHCLEIWFEQGSKIHFMFLSSCNLMTVLPFPLLFGGPQFPFHSNGGYAVTTFGPGLNKFGSVGGIPPCIQAIGSVFAIQNCDVIDSLHNGIELVDSYMYMDGCTSSTPNANAGVWAHSGSKINIRNNVAPAITGIAVGDFTIDDVALASTWAAIFGGAPYASAVEMVVAKVYDIAWAEWNP